MTTEEVIKRLKQARGRGTWKMLAEKAGCSPAYICDVLYLRRAPGPVILKFLGLKKVDAQYVEERES